MHHWKLDQVRGLDQGSICTGQLKSGGGGRVRVNVADGQSGGRDEIERGGSWIKAQELHETPSAG